jgi:transposase InsO family protein
LKGLGLAEFPPKGLYKFPGPLLNGPKLISVLLTDWAEKNGVAFEFIQPGKPTQNSYIERFNKTYSEEVLDFYLFKPLTEKSLLLDGTNLGRFTSSYG